MSRWTFDLVPEEGTEETVMMHFEMGSMLRYTVALLIGVCVCVQGLADQIIVHKDGREITGRIAPITSLAESGKNAPPKDALRPIVMIDNQLTRVFIPKRMVVDTRPSRKPAMEIINIRQRVSRSGGRVTSVGPIIKVTPFDEFGRRIFSMKYNNKEGRLDVIQGITKITPKWTKVAALRSPKGSGRPNVIWSMYIATSSIPSQELSRMLSKNIDPKDVDQRLRVVRLFMHGNRYREAQAELRKVIKDFPDIKEIKEVVTTIRQLSARSVLRELKMRNEAGQHRLTYSFVQQFPRQFPASQVGEAITLEAGEMKLAYRKKFKRIEAIQKKFDAQTALIQDPKMRDQLLPIRAEIFSGMNINTMGRLSTFYDLVSDKQFSAEDKSALAISGWLLGADYAIKKLPEALSLYRVRNLVEKYLRESIKGDREKILEKLATEEGATPLNVARIIRLMKPPLPIDPKRELKPGFFRLAAPGMPGSPDITYYVQLPPEYDPFRHYPAVLTLSGAGTTTITQLDWWTGSPDKNGVRRGQATRHGYIVIAPVWKIRGQTKYGYSAHEHAAVLNTLRDASRRFSINTDRVFLSGHSMGGDAAWDIGVSHPDLWAGVIPIVASQRRYIPFYRKNASYVPLYFVGGELDGNRMIKNASELDKYMSYSKFNPTVVEYIGRGHEHFHDEIQNIFSWMKIYERNFFPRKFETATMRTWDNYFWWVELANIPKRSIVEPSDWPPRGVRASRTKASFSSNNSINVTCGAGLVTIWLTPDMVDFKRRIRISVNGRRAGENPSPSLAVMLEDVRTRGDRIHPFWARVDIQSGRIVGRNRGASGRRNRRTTR